MNRPFIDSNVILYLLSSDTVKADKAETLLRKRGVVSVQVLNEITSACLRKLRMTWDEIETLLLTVKTACEVMPLTIATHNKAIELAKRHQFSFYDALICAVAIEAEAEWLLTEDMQNGMKIDGLRIKNPFH